MSQPAGPVLRLDALTKSFRAPDGELNAVIDIPAFVLSPGEQVALRGASGSGKTTLLHLVAGILTPDAGHVWVAGRDMAALPEAARDQWRAATIGYVFQTFNLLQGYTALENVLLGHDVRTRRRCRACRGAARPGGSRASARLPPASALGGAAAAGRGGARAGQPADAGARR